MLRKLTSARPSKGQNCEVFSINLLVLSVFGCLIGNPVHPSPHRCDVTDICRKLVRALGMARSEMARMVGRSSGLPVHHALLWPPTSSTSSSQGGYLVEASWRFNSTIPQKLTCSKWTGEETERNAICLDIMGEDIEASIA